MFQLVCFPLLVDLPDREVLVLIEPKKHDKFSKDSNADPWAPLCCYRVQQALYKDSLSLSFFLSLSLSLPLSLYIYTSDMVAFATQMT